ncbi:hypothetical protein F9K91_07635 [Brucella tritici]|uniref:CBM-cenC domain-containing protein n=1 Tax=Brucella tritici TaxID=94626 RepID=A0A833CMI8_9HYPH|nr:hypothetical protein [Brucella tritici]KAB2665992.1 hypothetical protein F9K91_07635 [Brucella tritici]
MPVLSGGFETGSDGWINTSSGSPVIRLSNAVFVRSGSWAADVSADTLQIGIGLRALPAEASNAVITASVWIKNSAQYDQGNMQLGVYSSEDPIHLSAPVHSGYNEWKQLTTTFTTTGQSNIGIGLSSDSRASMDDWIISYEPTTSTFCRDAGVWKPSNKYVKENGIWKPSNTKVKHAGAWKDV